jgi:hypothetical protein
MLTTDTATKHDPRAVPEQDEQALVQEILRLRRAEADVTILQAAIDALRVMRQELGGANRAPSPQSSTPDPG